MATASYDAGNNKAGSGSRANPSFGGGSEEIANEVIREHERLSNARGVFDSHCEEVARRILPASSGSFTQDYRTPGEKRNQEVFDITAAQGLDTFASILDSLLTPRNSTWHKVKASDEHLNRSREVRLYFEQVNALLFRHRYNPRANFPANNQKRWKSIGAFGNGCIFVDGLMTPKGPRGMRYKSVGLGNIWFSEDHQGIIDRVIRKFRMTCRQTLQMLVKPGDVIPPAIHEEMTKNPDKEFTFLHCVKARMDRDPARKDFKGMMFASYYVCVETRTLVREQGYNSFPYIVGRFEREDDEVMGRGPAMKVLPAVKTLNEEKKTFLVQGHRAVAPVLLTHDDGIIDGFSMKPGSLNSGGVTSDGRSLVHALPVGNLSVSRDMMEDERKDIKDVFLVNLFQILTENPQMTATESMERAREKGFLLAPTLCTQESESLGQQIEREIDILSMQGVLPPMPGLLREAQGEYSIVYDSPLSRAQRAEEGAGIMRAIEQSLAIFNATQDHSVMDWYDIDEITPAIAEIQGAPAKFIRSLETVTAIRNQRSQQQQDQQMIQAAPAAAAVMKAQAMSLRTRGGL